MSLEPELLEQFDRLCDERRLASRSEGFRHVLRQAITVSAWQMKPCDAFATLTLVCHRSSAKLQSEITELQHSQLDLVVSTTRVCVDSDTSLEVIILKGNSHRLKVFASQLCALKGVRSGNLVAASAHQNMKIQTIADRVQVDNENSKCQTG